MIIGRPKFVLASGSPRRLTLINQIGIEPDALRPADIDEIPKRGELPRACANRLARGKAEAALAAVKLDDELSGSYILAADTVVAVGRRILPRRTCWTRRRSACGSCQAAAIGCTPASAW